MGESGERGRKAEDIALGFLEDRGLILLDRNWRAGHKELDLIMSSRNSATGEERLHIVEVRSLSVPNLQMPFETIGYRKRKNLINAAAAYIYKNRIKVETQFDVVSVLFYDKRSIKVDYFPNAFTPQW